VEQLEAVHRQPARKCYSVALAGGRIAADFFSAVADLAKGTEVFSEHIHFFWGDERCVPPDDKESNYRLARERLLAPLAIPDAQIHRIRGEDPPTQAARVASEELCGLTPQDNKGLPVVDLVFLGMGPEGHVASLFPGAEQPQPGEQAVFRAVVTPKPPPKRITLDYGPLAAALQVWVLVSGAGKEEALRQSLTAQDSTPLGRVLASRRHARVLTDLSI
jgi:6-phosphogluconolactonase